jgi:hypothetical protein
MKIDNTIIEVRESCSKLSRLPVNGRIPIICLTPYEKNKAYYGIQFWTDEMIQIGTSRCTDNTISTFIEKL